MPRRVELDPLLVGGSFRSGQVVQSGVTRGRLRSADAQHPHYGVVAFGIDDDVESRCAAYAPRLRSGECFSHVTAAQLYGMPLPLVLERERLLHVAAVDGGGRARSRTVRGHRIDAGEIRRFRGLPVSAPEEVWCQLGHLVGLDDLVALGDFLVSGRPENGGRTPALTSRRALAISASTNAGKRGNRTVRAALPLVRVGVDSRRESLLRMLLIRFAFPEPVVHHPIPVNGGSLVLHPDLAWPHWRIAFEYEGDDHRTDARRFRADIRRKELMEDAGWQVIRVTADDLTVDRLAFIERVRRTISRAERALAR